MKANYFPEDDILTLTFSDNEIVRASSIDWNIHASYDAKGF